jgi:hypothetical protein
VKAFFSQVFISGGLNSLVLQLLIVQELVCRFLQVLILKTLISRPAETENGCHCIRNKGIRPSRQPRRINFFKRDPSLTLFAQDDDPGRIVVFW